MLTAAAFYFFGVSFFVFKMTNLVFFMLLLLAGYLLGRRIAGEGTGFFLAFILATLPAMLQYSRKSCLFFPEVALFVLAVYFLLAGENFTRSKYAFGLGVSCAAMLFIHYSGLLHFLVFAAFYFLSGGFSREKIRNGALAIGVCALALPWYINYLPAYMAERAAQSYPRHLFHSPAWLYSSLPKNPDFVLPVYFVILLAALPALIYCLCRSCGRQIRYLTFLTLSLCPLSLLALAFFKVRNSGLSILVMLVISAACSVALILQRRSRAAVFIRVLLAAAVLVNGIYIAAWPLFRAKTSFRVSPAGRFCDHRLDNIFFGTRNTQEELINYLYPYKKPLDALEGVLGYFREREGGAGAVFSCATYNLEWRFCDILYNGFLRGMEFRIAEDPASAQGSDYAVFMSGPRAHLRQRGGVPELDYYYRQVRRTVSLSGFILERVVPVAWHDYNQSAPEKTVLYILRRQ